MTSIRRNNALARESPQQAEERRAAEHIRRNVALGEENNVQAEQRRAAVSSRRKANRRQHMIKQQQYLIECLECFCISAQHDLRHGFHLHHRVVRSRTGLGGLRI